MANKPLPYPILRILKGQPTNTLTIREIESTLKSHQEEQTRYGTGKRSDKGDRKYSGDSPDEAVAKTHKNFYEDDEKDS